MVEITKFPAFCENPKDNHYLNNNQCENLEMYVQILFIISHLLNSIRCYGRFTTQRCVSPAWLYTK